MLVDRLLIILLSPALAFITTLTEIRELVYFLTSYMQTYFLLIMILLKISIKNRHIVYESISVLSGSRNNLMNKIRSVFNKILRILSVTVPKKNFKLLLLLFVFCIVEYAHILSGRQGLDGLTDIRMIFYSPLYGGIIVFTIYCIYLIMSSNAVRYFHIVFTVQLITYFSIFFIGYWFLLYFGVVNVIENTNFNNANGASYYALFACFILLLAKNDILQIKYPPLFFLINLSVILLNTTRGALLVLFIILAYKYFFNKKRKSMVLFFSFIAAFCLLLNFNVIIESVFGENFFLLWDYAYNSSIEEMSNSDNYISSLHDDRLSDSAPISSVSRIFVNYSAFLNFVNNPLIGVGQTESYSLEIIGARIHSFFFMLISSVGVVGMVVFIYLIKTIYSKNYNKGDTFIFYLFPFCILIFTNTIPVYFSLLPFMSVVLYSNKILQGGRHV